MEKIRKIIIDLKNKFLDYIKHVNIKKIWMPICFILCVLLFIFSIFKIIEIVDGYNEGVDTYKKVQESFVSERTKETKKEAETTKATEVSETTIATTVDGETKKKEEKKERIDYSEYEHEKSLNFMHTNIDYLLIPEYEFNFEALQEINPEVYGWIIISDTNINYPFVQGEDNEKYLRRTVLDEPNNAGCVFLDFNNVNPFEERNTILYAHNQKNGRMFHELINYDDRDYLKEHPFIKIYLPDDTMLLYQIFTSYETKESDPYQYIFTSDKEYVNFLNNCMEKSNLLRSKKFTEKDKIITLCTCTDNGNEYRRIVQAYFINKIAIEEDVEDE